MPASCAIAAIRSSRSPSRPGSSRPLPPPRGRAADRCALQQLGRRRSDPHLCAHEHQRVPRRLPLRRAPDGDAARRRRRAVDVLPGRQAHLRSGEPLPPAGAPDREAADDRGLHLPPLARPSLRPPAERSRLHRQLRQHDLRDRRQARAEPGAPAGTRDPADPARRSRAELLHERCAGRRIIPCRPVLGRLGGDRSALRPAARRCERGRPADARRDRRRLAMSPRSSRRSRTGARVRDSWASAIASTRATTRAPR